MEKFSSISDERLQKTRASKIGYSVVEQDKQCRLVKPGKRAALRHSRKALYASFCQKKGAETLLVHISLREHIIHCLC